MKAIRKNPTFPDDIPVSDAAMAVDDAQEIRDAEQIEESGGEATLYDESAAELDAEVVTGGGSCGVSASEIADDFLSVNARAQADEDQFVYAKDRGVVVAWVAKLRRWVPDGNKKHGTRYLFHTIRARCLRVYAESNLRRDWKAHLRSGHFPLSVVGVVISELHGVKYADEFDQNLDLMGLPDGKVCELPTGVMRDARPDDFISKSANVLPDSTQKPTRFLQFLDEISQHNPAFKEYILCCLGYFCTGRMTSRYLGFWTGPTSGGKSILCDLMVSILGDYAATATVKALAAGSEMSADKEMQLFHRVCGARVVFASESSATLKLDPGLCKKLASKEKLVCRKLFEDEYEKTPTFKWVISAQDLTFEKVDAAIQVRLQVAHFRQIFAQPKDMHRFVGALKADLQLGDKLEKERAGILALMLEYAQKWYRDGLQPPPCIVADTDKYFADVDDFGSWLDKRCAREKDAFTSGNMLLVDYQQAAEAMGIEPMKRDAFAKKLIAAGFKADRRRSDGGPPVGGYAGLRLRERDEDGDTGNE